MRPVRSALAVPIVLVLLSHFLEPTGDAGKRAALAPWAAPGGGGVSAVGNF